MKLGADAAKTLEQIARLAECTSQYEFNSLRRCSALLACSTSMAPFALEGPQPVA